FNNLPTSGIRGLTTFIVKATDNKGGVNGATIDVIENKAPVVTVTAPLPKYNNSNIVYVQGTSITVTANATDADGSIAKVEISQGANAPIVKTAAPYTATFASLPAPAPDGSIYFTVKAYDNNGATTSALIIAYRNRVPNVSITAPAAVTPGSTITITTFTNDVDGAVAKVEFFNGVIKLGESTTAPYAFSIANAVAGTYSLTAKATDDLGQSNASGIVTVNVATASCTVVAWNSSTAYSTPNRVSKGGTVYEAKWWTQNEDPATHAGQYDSWKVIGPCNARLSAAESLNTVNVSPVPFSDELFVDIKDNQAHIELYDLFGTKIAQADGSGRVTIPTAACAPGLYLCKVFVNGESKSFTVVKR
ncbi:MAG: T9SS type A sorting domain-containing protein, partial [Cytophagaceae bacterium]|nr:T9SS type A sorting domain-containing protein [Cytophagaceae bacterium]